jgi:hypothetical protein
MGKAAFATTGFAFKEERRIEVKGKVDGFFEVVVGIVGVNFTINRFVKFTRFGLDFSSIN